MKYFVAALCILALIVGFCTYDLYKIGKTADTISALLEQSEAAADGGDMANAEDLVKNAYDIWMKEESYASSVLTHDDVISVTLSLKLALKSAEIDDYTGLSEALTSAKFDLEHITDEERFQLKNIL